MDLHLYLGDSDGEGDLLGEIFTLVELKINFTTLKYLNKYK
ncbi:hypothetical protein [Prochlorococcus marinus]|uniref:Uncharacterized protein n=1 Tax=Prochlorococcus marinus str. PAC1 TaxID=59924 RepID=A0A0A2CAA2_PROMR|nr:hypothetical protein [Prochlorococcus marinus]KGG22457.1 hypothetical protein EV03_0128 [Prochlorococcus marinus str. PAC1]